MFLRSRSRTETTFPSPSGNGRAANKNTLANRWVPDIKIHLIGRSGDGKTSIEVAFADFVIGRNLEDMRDRVELLTISPTLAHAIENMKMGQWPEKTPPYVDGDDPSEQFVFKVDTTIVALISHPGKALRIDGNVTPESIQQRFGDGIMAVTFNAFRIDVEIAAKALLGLISTLQARPLNHNIVDATRIAYELLFGLNESVLKSRRVDYQEVCHASGCKIRWQPARDGQPGRFYVQPGKDETEPANLLRALRKLSDHAVRSDLDVNNLRQLTRKVPGILVVLTRMNLLIHIPSLTESDFDVLFEDAFGVSEDHYVSQRVIANAVRLTLRSDPVDYHRLEGIDPAGGRQLFRSIVRALSRTEISKKRYGFLSVFGWGQSREKALKTTSPTRIREAS